MTRILWSCIWIKKIRFRILTWHLFCNMSLDTPAGVQSWDNMNLYVNKFLLFLSLLALSGCGHPSADMVFNTSTEAYPLSSDAVAGALVGLGADSSGVSVTSVVKIEMQGIGEASMQSIWPQALSLISRDGDLRFVQLAKCYVQPHSPSASQEPILIGHAKAEDLSEDGRSLRFHMDGEPDLAGILKGPFVIAVEIEGDAPNGKSSVSANLTFKARVKL